MMFGLPIPGTPALVVAGVLILAVGVQTFRLNSAETTIADQRTKAAELTADIATKTLAGFQAGVAQQKAAQDEIIKDHLAIEAGLLADAARRSAENVKAMDTVNKALAGDQWKCLRDALPAAVLDVYKRSGT
jgi:hypothetical protein